MIFLGIDPGKTGGIAWIVDNAAENPEFYTGARAEPVIGHMKFDGLTPADVWGFVDGSLGHRRKEMRIVIEKVSSTPQMGVVSAFTFGRNYGFWEGCLAALKAPYAYVTPQKWQKVMGCLSKGNKNTTKAAAQRLYPNERITHAVADALLLATYCKQNHAQLF